SQPLNHGYTLLSLATMSSLLNLASGLFGGMCRRSVSLHRIPHTPDHHHLEEMVPALGVPRVQRPRAAGISPLIIEPRYACGDIVRRAVDGDGGGVAGLQLQKVLFLAG